MLRGSIGSALPCSSAVCIASCSTISGIDASTDPVMCAADDTIKSRLGGEGQKDSEAEELVDEDEEDGVVDEDEEDGVDSTPSMEQYSTCSSLDPDIGNEGPTGFRSGFTLFGSSPR
jgi:hypothetical protein